MALSDLNDEGAQAEVVRRLRRLGVDRALARAGARDGDEITVGAMTFTWVRTGDRSRQGRLLLGHHRDGQPAVRGAAAARTAGHTVVVVSSGAIAVGWDTLDSGKQRPSDPLCCRRCRPWASTA